MVLARLFLVQEKFHIYTLCRGSVDISFVKNRSVKLRSTDLIQLLEKAYN